MPELDPDAINALLPQTQCELCEYPGCMPYAEAIAAGEAPIDRCLPGGVATLHALAKLTEIDAEPLKASMQARTKPPSKVMIDEEACIGCTKCLPACPTDAIVGSGKHMHTILQQHCTGCDLCIPTCPVDCIVTIPATTIPDASTNLARFKAHQTRQQANQKRRQAPSLSKQDYLQRFSEAQQREQNRRDPS